MVKSHRVSRGGVCYETSRSDLLKGVGEGLLTQRKVGKANVFPPAPSLHNLLGAAHKGNT